MPSVVQVILVHPESVKSVFEWIKRWSINNFRLPWLFHILTILQLKIFSQVSDTWYLPVWENWFWWHALPTGLISEMIYFKLDTQCPWTRAMNTGGVHRTACSWRSAEERIGLPSTEIAVGGSSSSSKINVQFSIVVMDNQLMATV